MQNSTSTTSTNRPDKSVRTMAVRRQPFLLIACVATLSFTGCYLPILNGPPGTIGMQRSRAVLNDPFPSDTLGPPIGGARPRGFDLPLSETTTYQSHPQARRKGGFGGLGGFGSRNYQPPIQPPPPQAFPSQGFNPQGFPAQQGFNPQGLPQGFPPQAFPPR